MINRILIRMKVVQMLYSYMLTRNEFKIFQEPERQTRDSRFGFEMYQTLILVLLKLSGYDISFDSDKSQKILFKENELSGKLGKTLSANSDIKELINHRNEIILNLNNKLGDLHDKIISSTVYKDFRKKSTKDLSDEVNMWIVLSDTVISRDKTLLETVRNNEDFTQAGYDQAFRMFKETLSSYGEQRTAYLHAKKSLEESLDKSYELYHLLLLLPLELTQLQRNKIENAKIKYVPTSDDLNPNTRFIDNSFVTQLSKSQDMEDFLKVHPINLDGQYLLLKQLLNNILDSEIYSNYMEMPSTNHAEDCDFWRSVMKNIILPSDALAEMLEDSSIYWNDDLEIMGTFALKTIKQSAANESSVKLLPKFKDDDDAKFGAQLFLDAINNREVYRGYIDKFIDAKQWDADRIAFMDIVIMLVAISELINFPAIPIPVTMNEYIEIANSYSTPRSGQFINGMLFSIVNYLKEQGILNKE